jgi:hypothetical protein
MSAGARRSCKQNKNKTRPSGEDKKRQRLINYDEQFVGFMHLWIAP